jgi:hypothetical protein
MLRRARSAHVCTRSSCARRLSCSPGRGDAAKAAIFAFLSTTCGFAGPRLTMIHHCDAALGRLVGSTLNRQAHSVRVRHSTNRARAWILNLDDVKALDEVCGLFAVTSLRRLVARAPFRGGCSIGVSACNGLTLTGHGNARRGPGRPYRQSRRSVSLSRLRDSDAITVGIRETKIGVMA